MPERCTGMKVLLLPALIGALAACSAAPTTPVPHETSAAGAAGNASPSPNPSLVGLNETAAQRLSGELRCAFTAGGRSLLLAAADVDDRMRATAVVDDGTRTLLLKGAAPGGLDALTRGGQFGGERLRVSVVRGAAQPTGHEGSQHAATLTLVAGPGEQHYDGLWSCGP